MKILYITNGNGIDYLNDSVFIGLVNNGHDVTDSSYLWYLGPVTPEERKFLYGHGFSISGTLPKERSLIDRENIEERILCHEFDLVFFGSIFRCRKYLDSVLAAYKKEEIIFLDGEDKSTPCHDLLDKGIYFQREKISSWDDTYPVSFSIPRCKFFVGETPLKERFQSVVKPMGDHIYSEEKDYYEDYQKSIFGYTIKKGGWDCLRHYEIIANKCLPFFNGYENMPQYTMVKWPREMQGEANYLFYCYNQDRVEKLTNEFFEYALNNLTSEKVAENLLKKL